ncbi:MAG: HEAT repeat domain-containing protein [Pyrinomonadaceae bacterium]
MSDGNNHRGSNGSGVTVEPQAPPEGKRRTPWALAFVAVLFVVMPFLTWYGTTFWRTLSDAQVDEYLGDTGNLRHVQHALEEIDRRVIAGDANAKRWYPRVVQVSSDAAPDLRMTAAWVMGDDNREESFRAALVPRLNDPEPAVRRMAALSLSRFNDPRCRTELVAMLHDYSVSAGVVGSVETVLPVGSAVSRQTMIARVRTDAGEVREVRSPLAGRVKQVSVAEGVKVQPGDALLMLSPDPENVLQALRALYLVGTPEDVKEIEPYAGGGAGMTARVKEQAAQTLEMIVRRSGAKL